MKTYNIRNLTYFAGIIVFFLTSCSSPADKEQAYNRPPGHYPGNPAEDFAPLLQPAGHGTRNLALRRATYHSSAYDYNLTAQLVTDGITDTVMPWTLSALTSDENPLNRRERELLTDDNPVTTVPVSGTTAYVQIGLEGRTSLPAVEGLLLKIPLRGNYNGKKGPWQCSAQGSDDGDTWQLLGTVKGRSSLTDTTLFPLGPVFRPRIRFSKTAHYKYYRAILQSPLLQQWNIGEFVLLHNGRPLELKPSLHFTSAWMSAGNGHEWIYTDLGAAARLDSVTLHWISPAAAGRIQVSADASSWQDAATFTYAGNKTMTVVLAAGTGGRYVRLLTDRPVDGAHYVLSEWQVWGRGGVVPVPHEAAAGQDNTLPLAGGHWRLQRASQVQQDGSLLSRPGYDDASWLPATVPATVLVSYLNAGAIPDPNYGDNQLMVSESFFLSDFWYRNTFKAPASFKDKQLWLRFDGINWKAEIWLNGTRLAPLDGAFIRGRYDVTHLILPGKENVLAVLIRRNTHPGGMKEKTFKSPGLNGGVLGADNPTFHATIGWDWIPTIRGRDAGIWNDVFLTATGPVTLENPFVTTTLPLPDTTSADITLTVGVKNHSQTKVTGRLQGSFGEITFEEPVVLEAQASKTLVLSSSNHPELHLKNPRLWWPAGYGAPHLYDVKLSFVTDDGISSDKKSFRSGIRQMSYSTAGGVLKIWVNGKRFTARGGNWGFPESMLRYRKREYDIAVRYHRDMHFTMIRNWVGMTGDDEFWEACDKYGILVWQDFWLANPWDGPDPDDDAMFLKNAEDFILRIRNHPSIGLYCGRNEGDPPPEIEKGLRRLIRLYHPGITYIPNSADDVVSGHGPYRAMPLKYYFAERATKMLHSEMGMPNIMTLESLEETIPDSALWPQGRQWGLHDFCAKSAQSAISFNRLVEEHFGNADHVKEWVTLAQFVNYDGYRAMFEAQSRHRMGLLLWMSHPAWPSLVWQTYDYFFEPTAAYFGCKKASEPLHIQWNAFTDSVEAVNYSGRKADNLTAHIAVINMDGKTRWEKEVSFDMPEDTCLHLTAMQYPEGLTPVHFIRLQMLRDGKIISRNFYLHGTEEGNYKAVRQLPAVALQVGTHMQRENDRWLLTTEITNPSAVPALMVRLKVVRSESGDRILPVLYSDNYFALMPGEKRTLTMEVADADRRGEKPVVEVSGFNVKVER